jgi:hypothetical protein
MTAANQGYLDPGIWGRKVLVTDDTPTNGTSEVQHIDITGSPTGGTVRASFKGLPFEIAYDDTTTELQTKLRALGYIGSDGVTVTGSAGAWVLTFGGRLAKLNVPTIQIVENLLEGGTDPDIAVTVATPGVTATHRGAPTGARLRDTTHGVEYINTGTIYAPTWTEQTSPSAEMATFESSIPATAITALTYTALTGAGAAANNTLEGGAGRMVVPLRVNLVELTTGDLLTAYTPGFAGKVVSVAYAVATAATTTGKAATVTPKIGSTALSGGVLALTTTNASGKGTVVASTAISGANTFTNSDTLSITASAVTAFAEGAGWLLLGLQNLETIDDFADLAAKLDEVLALLHTTGIMA